MALKSISNYKIRKETNMDCRNCGYHWADVDEDGREVLLSLRNVDIKSSVPAAEKVKT